LLLTVDLGKKEFIIEEAGEHSLLFSIRKKRTGRVYKTLVTDERLPTAVNYNNIRCVGFFNGRRKILVVLSKETGGNEFHTTVELQNLGYKLLLKEVCFYSSYLDLIKATHELDF
jgi:hypothetical protein